SPARPTRPEARCSGSIPPPRTAARDHAAPTLGADAACPPPAAPLPARGRRPALRASSERRGGGGGRGPRGGARVGRVIPQVILRVILWASPPAYPAGPGAPAAPRLPRARFPRTARD